MQTHVLIGPRGLLFPRPALPIPSPLQPGAMAVSPGQRHSASTRNQVAAAFLGGALVITLLLLLAPRERCRGPGEC